jgi:foldase protein PrsA
MSMSRMTRCASALGVVVAVVGLTACGGGISGDAVVQVGANSISKAMVDHWTRIEAVLTYKVIPRQPVPRGVVPDPPKYTACIAYLEANAPQPVKGQSKPTASQLKSQCQQRYVGLQRKVLSILITFDWMSGEIADQGAKVTDGEVKQAFQRFEHEEFSTEADFHKYLTYTGMSISDVLLLMRNTVLGTKLQQKALAKKGPTVQQQEQAFARFAGEFRKKWTAKTSCRTGYVVPGCKQYKGTEAPV